MIPVQTILSMSTQLAYNAAEDALDKMQAGEIAMAGDTEHARIQFTNEEYFQVIVHVDVFRKAVTKETKLEDDL